MFLTRLPLTLGGSAEPDMLARTVWAFPIVGAGLGLLSGLVYAAGHGLALPPMLAAILAVAALVLMTGALHEDGLADVADGLGGGATPARKLEIMRDSRIGSYGVIALTLALLARIAALAHIDDPGTVVATLIAAEAVSRAWLGPIMAAAHPARTDGLGAGAGRPSRRGAGASIFLGALILLFLGIAALGLPAALLAFAMSGGSAILFARSAQHQLGGITGDVLGACQQIAVLAFLLGTAATT